MKAPRGVSRYFSVAAVKFLVRVGFEVATAPEGAQGAPEPRARGATPEREPRNPREGRRFRRRAGTPGHVRREDCPGGVQAPRAAADPRGDPRSKGRPSARGPKQGRPANRRGPGRSWASVGATKGIRPPCARCRGLGWRPGSASSGKPQGARERPRRTTPAPGKPRVSDGAPGRVTSPWASPRGPVHARRPRRREPVRHARGGGHRRKAGRVPPPEQSRPPVRRASGWPPAREACRAREGPGPRGVRKHAPGTEDRRSAEGPRKGSPGVPTGAVPFT